MMANSRSNTLKVHTEKGWKREMADEVIDKMSRRANTELEILAEDLECAMGASFDQYIHDSANEERLVKRQRLVAKNVVINGSRPSGGRGVPDPLPSPRPDVAL